MGWKNLSEKLKLSISLDQQFKVIKTFVFILCQAEDYQNIFKLSCRPLAFTSFEAFLKKTEVWN